MEEGASFSFTAGNRRGMIFEGGGDPAGTNGAVFRNLTTRYENLCTDASATETTPADPCPLYQHTIEVKDTYNTAFYDVDVDGAPQSGLFLNGAVNPLVERAAIKNTRGTAVSGPAGAGLRLENSTGATIKGATIRNTSGTGFLVQQGTKIVAEDIDVDGTGDYNGDLNGAPQQGMQFAGGSDILVRRATVNNAVGAGVIFYGTTRPSVDGATISNTRADGLHFDNCQDAVANDITVENSGDDGLAFLNYSKNPDNTGGQATDITVRHSKTRGITVVGQRHVTIEGFSVDSTTASGVMVAQENSYKTRVPGDVRILNGTIRNAGKEPPGPRSGDGVNNFGVRYANVGSGVEFGNIEVFDPASTGVSGYAKAFDRQVADGTTVREPAGEATLTNVTVHSSPSRGFDVAGGRHVLDGLVSRSSGGTGFKIEDMESLRYGTLRSYNSSQSPADTLARAFNFEGNASIGPIEGKAQQLIVEDDQAAPTGGIVNAEGLSPTGARQSKTLGTVYDRVNYGDTAVDQDANTSALTYALNTGVPPPPNASPPPNTPPPPYVYKPTPNYAAPRISNMTPRQNSNTRNRRPTITATVHDSQTDLTKRNITMSVDGRRVRTFTYTGATNKLKYAPRNSLSKGKHTVKIAANDGSVNKSRTWSFRVNR